MSHSREVEKFGKFDGVHFPLDHHRAKLRGREDCVERGDEAGLNAARLADFIQLAEQPLHLARRVKRAERE